tara:strand:+ start:343 stop:834 length:492 start_codon:yes stop_codon:yes gene_type:complete
VRTIEAGTKHLVAFFLCPGFTRIRVFLVKTQFDAGASVMDSFKRSGEGIVMVCMLPVQLKKVAVMFKNSEILVRTMDPHAEDFCQEISGSLDICCQEVNPETHQVPAKFRSRPRGGDAYIQTFLPDSSIPLCTKSKAGRESRLFCPANQLDVKAIERNVLRNW